MSNQPYIAIKINGELVEQTVYDISIHSSLKEILPTASFKIIDNSGMQFSQLKGCLLGSQVNFGLTKGEDVIWSSTAFYIKYVFDGCESDKSYLAGAIQIFCEHSWNLYADRTQHAYKPQKISETIKQLTDDFVTSKGKSLNVSYNKKDIQESSETSTFPRYRCGESEVEFIRKELLPILQMDGVNGFFFMDHKGAIKLKSFSKLWKEAEKALISSKENSYSTAELEQMDEYAKNTLNLKTRYFYDDIDILVGKTTDYFEEFNKGVNFEIPDTTTGYIQITDSYSGPRAKTTFLAKLPIIGEQLKYFGKTKVDSFSNVVVSDAIGMECAKQSELNDLFTLHINLPNQIVENLSVGDTIYLYTKDNKQGDRKRHWTSGKWLISELDIIKPEAGLSTPIYTNLTLIRPTFGVLNDKSTVDSDYLYGVI